jgi:hypothetical protein
MRAAGRAMPWARRLLIECCAAAGLPDRAWHTALDDARGAADLLVHLLAEAPHLVEPDDDHRAIATRAWPALPPSCVEPVLRTPLGHVEPHFLGPQQDRSRRRTPPLPFRARRGRLGRRRAHPVSRHTTVVVAADPDSLSGKARDARACGVPVVNEHVFLRVLAAMG